ncbi:MurR/RpiR family transcriptional regulator [Mariniluteicoccus flavus]
MARRDVDQSLHDWLGSLVGADQLTGRTGQAFREIVANPGRSSYSPAGAVAAAAGVSVSAITRLAQRLGYAGWPDFQSDLRAHYVSHLSVVEVATEHGLRETPFHDSVRRDAESTAEVLRRIPDADVVRVAERIAAGRSIFVTAQGSFAAVGHALSHNMRLAGFPCHELLDRPASISNAVAFMQPDDVLIVCSYWRLYQSSVTAAQTAHDKGATVIALTDNLTKALADCADECLIVPAEGTSFFPSLAPAMSVVQGLVATLASLDPERTLRSMRAVEESWGTFDLLHRSVRGQG